MKKSNSKTVFIVIGVILFLAIISQFFGDETSSDDPNSESTTTESALSEIETSTEPETTEMIEAIAPETQAVPLDFSVAIGALKVTLESMDYDYLSIDHEEDDGLHFINIKRNAPEGTALGLVLYYKNDSSFKESWDFLIESDKNVSKELADFLTDSGYANAFVSIYLLSDANSENTLYTVMNGIKIYNAADDLD